MGGLGDGEGRVRAQRLKGRPTYSICIVAHNTPYQVERCLQSVARLDDEAEVLFWDNASDERHSKIFKRIVTNLPQGRYFHHDTNAGFGYPACELGKKAKGEYLLFLNSDAVLPKDALVILATPFVCPTVGVVGPKGNCHTLTPHGKGHPSGPLDYIEGSCLMTPKKLFDELEGFDHETFQFAYCEDADYSLRAREAGYELVEVDLPGFIHERAVTARSVKDVDVEGYGVINSLKLRTRWKDYVETKELSRTIVVRRSRAIGDVLQLTALARAVHQVRPRWRLHAETGFPELFENNPLISTYQPTGFRSDLEYVDLDGAYERWPKLHMVTAYARAMGLDIPKPPRPEVYLSEEEAKSELYVKDPVCVIHYDPTSWPGRDIEFSFIDEITQQLVQQKWNTARVGLTQQRSLRETITLILRAQAFVGIDSFPSTVAMAAGIPSVVLFGCIDPKLRLPHDAPNVKAVQANGLACLGCHHEHPPPVECSPCLRQNPGPIAQCMLDITVEQVMTALKEALDAPKGTVMTKAPNPRSFYGIEYLKKPLASDALNRGEVITRWDDNGVYHGTAQTAVDLIHAGLNHGLPPKGPVEIADVGCGRGWVVKHLNQKGHHARGFEYGSEAVEHSVCDAELCDLTEHKGIPARDGEFDFVLCHGVLSHLPQPLILNGLKELARVIRPLGMLWTNILTGKHELQQHHMTFEPSAWWEPLFEEAGFIHQPDKWQPWLRDKGYSTRTRQWSEVWYRKQS